MELRGRGTPGNPANRFEKIHYADEEEQTERQVPSHFYVDPSRTILSFNQSPDVGFDVSLNPYRGCEHGCVYCYARPTHEYLGFSCGLDFETQILVKEKAPQLLRQELMKPGWKPQPIALSGNTDPYQPIEKKLALTRKCLDVLREFMNPVVVVTKNSLVTRDLDILKELAVEKAVLVNVSITTLIPSLQRTMEPRASSPAARLKAVEVLSSSGVPTRALIAPVIPGLNDHEIPSLLKAAAAAGASDASYILLRLPHGVRELFEAWLRTHYPLKAGRVLGHIREVRGGKLNDPSFTTRMRGQGPYADQIQELFNNIRARLHLGQDKTLLSTESFRRPGTAEQKPLFNQPD